MLPIWKYLWNLVDNLRLIYLLIDLDMGVCVCVCVCVCLHMMHVCLTLMSEGPEYSPFPHLIVIKADCISPHICVYVCIVYVCNSLPRTIVAAAVFCWWRMNE